MLRFMQIPDYSYFSLVKGLVLLVVIYILVRVLKALLLDNLRLKRYRSILEQIFRAFEYLIFPLATIVLTVIFVYINPYQNGLIVLGVLLLGFNSIRNFYSRFLLRSQQSFEVGDRIKSGDIEGVVLNIRSLNVELHTRDGISFIPYSHLVNKPYTVMEGAKVQNHLALDLAYNGDQEMTDGQLLSILYNSQYLDLTQLPKVHAIGDKKFNIDVLLHKGVSKQDVRKLLAEYKFDIKQ